MKILQFTAEHFKRLQVVEITPNGNIVEITGKNGSGKSSTLDAIEAALAGGKMAAVPVRKGQKSARIQVSLGDEKVELVVERVFNAETGQSNITVSTGTGARKTGPQQILNALLGELTFDPLAFTRMKAAEQFDALRRLVKLDVDFDELDGLNTRDINLRTEAGRAARALRAQAEGIIVADGLPDEPVNTKEILDELQGVANHNSAIEREALSRADKNKQVNEHFAAAKALRDEAAELRRQADMRERAGADREALAGELRDRIAALPPLPELKDAAEVRARLTAAEDTNVKIAARLRRTALDGQAVAKEAEVEALSQAIEGRRQAKADAIRSAQMPIDGLGFGDKHVTLNGLPFDQASTAEQLRVSVAIAMAANPTLRVLRIKEGSFLDGDAMKLLAGMAAERDYQVWIESVMPHDGPVIVMEDGKVRSAPTGSAADEGAPAAAPPEAQETLL